MTSADGSTSMAAVALRAPSWLVATTWQTRVGGGTAGAVHAPSCVTVPHPPASASRNHHATALLAPPVTVACSRRDSPARACAVDGVTATAIDRAVGSPRHPRRQRLPHKPRAAGAWKSSRAPGGCARHAVAWAEALSRGADVVAFACGTAGVTDQPR
jgi:hypothetical protein